MSRIFLYLFSAGFLLFTNAVAADQKQYLGHWVYDGKLNEQHLLSFAEKGHVPAIIDAAQRFLHGDGVEQDTGTAWYWLKRAQQVGVDISSITPKTLNNLLKKMSEQDRYSLIYLARYHDDLDLNGVAIPASFRALTPEVPAPLTDQEVVTFIEKFNGLNRRGHNQAYMDVEIELGMRATGIRFVGNISIDGQLKPLGMSDDEFARRKCNFNRAIAAIQPYQHKLDANKLRQKDNALTSLLPKSASFQFSDVTAQYVRDVLQTGRFCPNPESEGIKAALVWARELEKMTSVDLHVLAEEHFKMSGSMSMDQFQMGRSIETPEEEYELFLHYNLASTIRKFVDFLHPPPINEKAYLSRLVYLSANNDIASQLRLARRLEFGDSFKQDNAKAYFWYQQALKNGGGEAAQSAMDRLLPQLSKADFVIIGIWLKYGSRPY